MKFSIFLVGFLLCVVSLYAQSPSGKWKHTAAISEMVNGKKTELMEPFYKKHPCMKTSYYEFHKNNTVTETAPDCSDEVFNQFSIGGSTWKMNGKTISITFHDDTSVSADYQVEYKGDTMIWTYTFPGVTRPEDVKRLTMIFTRVTS